MPTTEPCPLRAICAPRKPVSLDMLNRREWVKCFALGWAAAVGGGARSTLLADISPGVNVANVIELKTADFPVLQSTYGSVRLGLFTQNASGGKMVVTRGPGDVFHAVNAVCTHEGQIIDAYLHGDTQRIICYGHDSHYSMDGTVLQPGVGSVNQANLPKFNTSYANGVVRIEIPGLGFKLNTFFILTETETSKRLALNFTQRQGAFYRVKYTPDMITPPVAALFATGPGGVANLLVTPLPASANTPRTLYVDSTQTRGFYFIEMVVDTEVAYSD